MKYEVEMLKNITGEKTLFLDTGTEFKEYPRYVKKGERLLLAFWEVIELLECHYLCTNVDDDDLDIFLHPGDLKFIDEPPILETTYGPAYVDPRRKYVEVGCHKLPWKEAVEIAKKVLKTDRKGKRR